MNSGYGEKISKAVKAVRQMHIDANALLKECDETVGRDKKIFPQNPSIRHVSWSQEKGGGYEFSTDWIDVLWTPRIWMASGRCRYYYKPGSPQPTPGQDWLFEGVTVAFDVEVGEPLFIVGQLTVADSCLEMEKKQQAAIGQLTAAEILKMQRKQEVAKWALYRGFFRWNHPLPSLKKVIRPSSIEDSEIKSMKLIAVPLYPIEDIRVQALMDEVRQSP